MGHDAKLARTQRAASCALRTRPSRATRASDARWDRTAWSESSHADRADRIARIFCRQNAKTPSAASPLGTFARGPLVAAPRMGHDAKLARTQRAASCALRTRQVAPQGRATHDGIVLRGRNPRTELARSAQQAARCALAQVAPQDRARPLAQVAPQDRARPLAQLASQDRARPLAQVAPQDRARPSTKRATRASSSLSWSYDPSLVPQRTARV
jgi:hypothetical protein